MNKTKDSPLVIVYYLSIVLLMLKSMGMSWLWSVQYHWFVFFTFAISFFVANEGVYFFDKKLSKVLITYILISIITTLFSPFWGLYIIIQNLAHATVILGVLYLKSQYKQQLFHWFVLVFTLILVITITAWLLYLIGIPFSHGPTVDVGDGFHYLYDYGFFLISANSLGLTPRFASVFLEPGWVGTLCCFVVFGIHFDRKKLATYLCLAGILLSLSLSAIVNLIVCVILWVVLNSKSKNKLIYLVGVSTVIVAFFAFAIYYNGGNNVLNEKIVERLAFDEDLGIVGNNRTNEIFNGNFEDVISGPDRWFGIGHEIDSDYQEMNSWYSQSSGIRKDIMDNGLIGTGLFLLFLVLLLIKYHSRQGVVFFVCFIMASFIRNLWRSDCYTMLYIVSLCTLWSESINQENSFKDRYVEITKEKNNKRHGMECG